jgi:tetratricopeptide (TPR) repeat protein
MTRNRKPQWMINAAAACVAGLGLATGAAAQQRVGNDGRAMDANNRLGSGGVNSGGQRYPVGVTGNQVVTGNVTAGREFRGFVPYTDPFAFRGRVAGVQTDDFARGSSGIPRGGISNANATLIKPFYGDARTAEVPPGFVQQPNSLGFIPAPSISRQPGDFRMGAALPLGTSQVMLPMPGQLILPGPVDPSTQLPTVITASPLYGVRQWDTNNTNDMGFLQGLNETSRVRLDSSTIQRMRRELEEPSSDESSGSQDPTAPVTDAVDTNQLNLLSLSPFESPQNSRVNSTIKNQNLATGSSITNEIASEGGTRQKLLIAPAQQSTQYAELQRRLKKYQAQFPGMENQKAGQEYNQALRDKQKLEEAAKTGTGLPGDTTGGTTPPGAPPQGTPSPAGLPGADELLGRNQEKDKKQPTAIPGSLRPGDAPAREKPLVVSSLATGVSANSLKDFLGEAESLMQQGKFYSALEQYDSAELIAPNNPMVTLGRANAELAASYYVRADAHLRDAFAKDAALLMAQYDLKSFIGGERLDFLVKDLKEIASTDKNEPRPVLLLAYIMYNTGNERRAAAYLDLAEKRAGKADPFYQLLRKYWVLPSQTEGGEELTK